MTPPRWMLALLAATALIGMVAASVHGYQERQRLHALLQTLGNRYLENVMQQGALDAPRSVVAVDGRRVEVVETTYPFASFPKGSAAPQAWLVEVVIRLRTVDTPRLQYKAVGLIQSLQPQRAPVPDSEALPPIHVDGP